ncbi:hypothetical protein [Legionella bononiensis]|uniref:Uncharacterized protein n=1 Tax=Legionella bononiensis TaxID=2793102 RepID=A0ABS1W9L3_9GAMM|nr:hypothetical protein [Legionella bononiensis]MBL7480767.1 hypothetical protein [Legionella bononiensis]MBL7526034.1 hypothetical protein [Legionella bononiensis]MBL7563471.1 hypothetical protein [Legionella bononiensis]
MSARQQLSQFLQTHHIQYELPAEIKDDERVVNPIRAVCERLMHARPSLLKPGYLKNLEALMRVAQDALFFTGNYNGQEESWRPIAFQLAIDRLASANPSVLNQDTFNGICRITTANLDQRDIEFVAQCFIDMYRRRLLSKTNIQDLVEKVINAPLRLKTSTLMLELNENGHTESVNGPDIHERSCAETLNNWLSACHWLRQADFSLMMRSACREDVLFIYMQKLYEKRLNTPANCQALIDSGIPVDSIRNGLKVGTQKELNESLFQICTLKLQDLKTKINSIKIGDDESAALSLHNQALSVYKQLCSLRNSREIQSDPRKFLHTIVVIHNALPTQNTQPKQSDVDELIATGYGAKGHPSELWKTAGILMMSLGTAIASAAGIALCVSSLGIAAPLGISIAAVGVASALTGAGFFAYGSTRSGLSKSILDLTEAIQQPVPQPVFG